MGDDSTKYREVENRKRATSSSPVARRQSRLYFSIAFAIVCSCMLLVPS